MLFADTNLAFEPAYPWSIPTIGPAAMFGVALGLTALTVWTYLGVRQANWRRILAVLLLRLGALAVAFCILARPSVAITQLEGVEASKLLVVLDASASMNVAETPGKPTRWQQLDDLWKSSSVERRLRQLAQQEKIEIVKYLGSDELRPDSKDAQADGPRTEMGVWLAQLWDRHGQDKRVRGIALFSDGADNGTRFRPGEKARLWRGVAPIHAFGLGDPNNARFKKDLGLTKIDVKPEPIFINAPLQIEVTVQAPGFDKIEFHGVVKVEDVNKSNPEPSELAKIGTFKITEEKGQKIKVAAKAPAEPGEYKITVEMAPHADETNTENNKISTYIQVSKEMTNILWVDRPRVYEPTRIIQLALAPEEKLKVHFIALGPNETGNPAERYQLDQNYDVIVIGDISAKQFSLGDDKLFERIKKMVNDKKGLLMLGGSETLAMGGWKDTALRSVLPVDLDLKEKKPAFTPLDVAPTTPTWNARELDQYPFLRFDPDPVKNAKLWEDFEALEGYAPLGNKTPGATELLHGKDNKELLMAATQAGGRVVVFAGDSTADRWINSRESAPRFTHFWKQLILWLANRQDSSSQLALKLDKRRIAAGASDVLGFTVSLRDKGGAPLVGAQFTGKVVRVGGQQELPVRIVGERGSFQGAKEPGEYQLIVGGRAKEVTGKNSARFTVAVDDIETLRPLAEHETLKTIASAAEGRFHPATEEAFLQYLDELAAQVNRESRHKTSHWPDWKRLPASESGRDQLAGLWHSFALVSMLLFMALLAAEWLLRRMWGMV